MRGVRPQLEWRRRKAPKAACKRGHALTGYNAKARTSETATPQCRACHGANQWAKKRDLFNDDPRTLAYANDLFARYQEMDP